MPNHHEMPATWRAHGARNGRRDATVAERAPQQRDDQPALAIDELARRRVARFAAEEARRLAWSVRPPQPPAAS